ncbi:type II toxin-antitoxin system HigB family toxin [Cysteiniphilum sp. QT6929]|uniref:type II toxin-antitoxin system HigB family toxin n=1 Tax=Cysteiniphilum sp. QT6929 TaxID=2975055 RepID=UPI0024B3758B|nr:type II toxin-antitoxin system HigB family toxin [Cysteiniphilum sp. QT6929]WHN65204.1 type II toxin-antitoxin system HigB family toxin [Cysteiniphilum sp. QT6929]
MIVINKELIIKFCKKHARAKKSFDPLLKILESNEFSGFRHLTETFKTADYVYHVFTIFDVAGHNYRMVTIVDYDFAVIDVRHIWTHEEYNKKQSILKKEAKKHANDK